MSHSEYSSLPSRPSPALFCVEYFRSAHTVCALTSHSVRVYGHDMGHLYDDLQGTFVNGPELVGISSR